jgi:molybdopterin synthase sulfur carrier subunit
MVRAGRRFTTIDLPSGAIGPLVHGEPSGPPLPEVPRPMSVIVRVPTTLRTLTSGQAEVAVDGATVGEVLTALEAIHPGFADRILDDAGALRRFVNVFVADDDVRFLDGLGTPVPDGETVSIIPAVAGG